MHKFTNKHQHGGPSQIPFIEKRRRHCELTSERKRVRTQLRLECSPFQGDTRLDPVPELFPIVPSWIDADLT